MPLQPKVLVAEATPLPPEGGKPSPEYERTIRKMGRRAVSDEKRALRLLEDARKEIVATLGRSPAEWKIAYLSSLLQRVDEQVADLKGKLNGLTTDGVETLRNGAAEIAAAIIPGDAPIRMVGLDPNVARVLTDYRAELITNLTKDVRSAVVRAVQRAMLSGKTLGEVEKELGSVIRDRGRFGTLGQRVRTIIRTEYKKELELANQRGLEQASEDVPGLKKQWLSQVGHATMPRPAHAAANGQVVDVDQPFTVGGEKLMQPGDPAGSPGNVINCRCRSLPVLPEEEPVASGGEPQGEGAASGASYVSPGGHALEVGQLEDGRYVIRKVDGAHMPKQARFKQMFSSPEEAGRWLDDNYEAGAGVGPEFRRLAASRQAFAAGTQQAAEREERRRAEFKERVRHWEVDVKPKAREESRVFAERGGFGFSVELSQLSSAEYHVVRDAAGKPIAKIRIAPHSEHKGTGHSGHQIADFHQFEVEPGMVSRVWDEWSTWRRTGRPREDWDTHHKKQLRVAMGLKPVKEPLPYEPDLEGFARESAAEDVITDIAFLADYTP